jgi:transposase
MRLVAEAREPEPDLSLNAAVLRIGPRVGVNADTLRGWCTQAGIDAGRAAGTTSCDAQTIEQLRAGVRELERANEIVLAASSFSARELDPRLPGGGVHRRPPRAFRGRADVPGVRWARRAHRPGQVPRRQGPAALGAGGRGRGAAGRNRPGACRPRPRPVAWPGHARSGTGCTVKASRCPRCTIERRMRSAGLRGASRGHRFVTTRPTSCGWSTSPTCRPGPARCSPHSSPMCSPGGSSAGRLADGPVDPGPGR